MSARNRYSILKGVSPNQARSILAAAATVFPGPMPRHSKWADSRYVTQSTQVTAVPGADALTIFDDAWPLATEIARCTSGPHLELRVQEGDHWDFTLYQEGQIVADFSTRVGYFNDDEDAPRPWKQGDATAFAETWQVPLKSVSPYLFDWDMLAMPTQVAGDQYSAGDWCQVFDFMRAIGLEYPHDNPKQFLFDYPAWTSSYFRQPRWRRAVRRLSVWYKGTYPDVPRHTPEQREHFRKLKAQIQVYRLEPKDPTDE